MATLAGTTISDTFDSLLHVENNTAGLVATSTDSRVIQDGVGANSALALATDSIRITSTNKLYFNDVGGEYISGNGSILSIVGGSEIDLTATAIDINGTVDISGTLELNDDISILQGKKIFFDTGSTDTYIYADTSSDEILYVGADDDIILQPDDDLIIQAGTTEYVRFDGANKRVGIGTDVPLFDLHVESSSSNNPYIVLRNVSTTSQEGGNFIFDNGDSNSQLNDNTVLGEIVFRGRDNDGGEYINAAVIGARIDGSTGANDMPGEIWFETNDTTNNSAQRMCILGNGFVGIGESTPTFPLHVKGTGTDTYVTMFDSTGTANTSYGIQIQCGDTDHSDDALTHYITFKESDGGTVGEIDNGGGSGALRINTASDERLKENIKDTEVDGLNIINNLTLREFNWKKRYNKKVEKCGLIAQEVRKVLPSAVTEMSDDDKTLGISEPGFVYTLIKAVQELSASNDALKARIEVLEAA